MNFRGVVGGALALSCLVFPGALANAGYSLASLSSPADYRSLTAADCALIYTVQDLQNIGQNLSSTMPRQ